MSPCLETGFVVSQLISRFEGRVDLIFIWPIQAGIEVVRKISQNLNSSGWTDNQVLIRWRKYKRLNGSDYSNVRHLKLLLLFNELVTPCLYIWVFWKYRTGTGVPCLQILLTRANIGFFMLNFSILSAAVIQQRSHSENQMWTCPLSCPRHKHQKVELSSLSQLGVIMKFLGASQHCFHEW